MDSKLGDETAEVEGEETCWTYLGRIHLNLTHAFCFVCMLGAVAVLVIGVIGIISTEDERHDEGTCVLTGRGECRCAEWTTSSRRISHDCVAYEAVLNATFLSANKSSVRDNVQCKVQLGGGSMESCRSAAAKFEAPGHMVSIADITTPVAPGDVIDAIPCRLHDDTFNCFATGDTTNPRAYNYVALTIAGALWLFCAMCGLAAVVMIEVNEVRVKLHNDKRDTELAPLPKAALMSGEPVVVVKDNQWVRGRILCRDGAQYDVQLTDGEVLERVNHKQVRSANFALGGWVCASEDLPVREGSVIAKGVLGVVTEVPPSSPPSPGGRWDTYACEVRMGGTTFDASLGQVVPCAPLYPGLPVEVREEDSGVWQEGIISSIHSDGIVLAEIPGEGDAKAYEWVRLASPEQQERMLKEAQLASVQFPEESVFVFIDPESRQAPTVMTSEEVGVYGGVRGVCADIKEHRSATSTRLATATGMLLAGHITTQLLQRAKRTDRQPLLPVSPPLPPASSPQHQDHTPY